jgi:hypothetical protein
MIGSRVYALRPLKVDCRTDFDVQLAALDAGRGEAREVAVDMSNKLSFLLYPLILASYDDIKLLPISWRSSFWTCRVSDTELIDVFTSKKMGGTHPDSKMIS